LNDIYATTVPLSPDACQLALSLLEPISFQEAVTHNEWHSAMEEELLALKKHQTWSLIDLPDGKKAIGLKWVFRTKIGLDGKVTKYRATIVVKGYSQEYGIDFEEIFSPVARFETIRLIMSLAT
jgi:hypothetical protein